MHRREGGNVTTEVKTGLMQSQAWSHQKLEEVRDRFSQKPSEGWGFGDILISDFHLPNCESMCFCFKPPSLRSFVSAIIGN